MRSALCNCKQNGGVNIITHIFVGIAAILLTFLVGIAAILDVVVADVSAALWSIVLCWQLIVRSMAVKLFVIYVLDELARVAQDV